MPTSHLKLNVIEAAAVLHRSISMGHLSSHGAREFVLLLCIQGECVAFDSRVIDCVSPQVWRRRMSFASTFQLRSFHRSTRNLCVLRTVWVTSHTKMHVSKFTLFCFFKSLMRKIAVYVNVASFNDLKLIVSLRYWCKNANSDIW